MSYPSLKAISWNVTEQQYRNNPALSYSTLARFEREGFNKLDSLFESLDTPSLTFGSMVDTLITEGKEVFNSKFLAADFPAIPDSIIKIVKEAFNKYHSEYRNLTDISNDALLTIIDEQGYQKNWKPTTRCSVVKEKGAPYYHLLWSAKDKKIVDIETKEAAFRAVEALKTSECTKHLFAPNNPFEPEIERLYQLKFITDFEDIPYRCMADLILVNHKTKQIIPVDLKTSSKPEWDFFKSFVDWRYKPISILIIHLEIRKIILISV